MELAGISKSTVCKPCKDIGERVDGFLEPASRGRVAVLEAIGVSSGRHGRTRG
jgi:hypothetical protein